MLRTLDAKWKDHLYTMDQLKDSVGLRAYGQKDPLQEYQREGFAQFEEMYENMQIQSVSTWFHVEVSQEGTHDQLRPQQQQAVAHRGDDQGAAPAGRKGTTQRRTDDKVGRNDPCPCGSGKKYKKCCMKKDAVKA
jgi:preprotein translocase subunit SecA